MQKQMRQGPSRSTGGASWRSKRGAKAAPTPMAAAPEGTPSDVPGTASLPAAEQQRPPRVKAAAAKGVSSWKPSESQVPR